MRQWLRKVRATFFDGFVVNPGDMSDSELKISFEISKSISSSANTATIKIWNLNRSHRNSLGRELDDVQLEAGYMPKFGEDNVGIIFRGQIRDAQHERQGADIVTTLTCGDGDRSFRKATISQTFSSGSTVSQIAEGIYQQMASHGLSRGEWLFPKKLQPYKRPYSICGACTRELNTLSRGHNFYWSVQNNVLEIIPYDEYLPGVVLISEETGMIGAPTTTDNGVKVKALLNPEIRPNRIIDIKSNAYNGIYRVSAAAYTGDNKDGQFEIDISGETIQERKVNQGAL